MSTPLAPPATVLVTGATSGVGAALCDLLVLRGHTVLALARRAAHLPARPGLHPVTADLADLSTIPALCRVGRMIAVVPERRKAEAVKGSLEGPITPRCPGSYLRQQAHCTLYLDPDSSSLLRS